MFIIGTNSSNSSGLVISEGCLSPNLNVCQFMISLLNINWTSMVNKTVMVYVFLKVETPAIREIDMNYFCLQNKKPYKIRDTRKYHWTPTNIILYCFPFSVLCGSTDFIFNGKKAKHVRRTLPSSQFPSLFCFSGYT